jgi:hypothetical protein
MHRIAAKRAADVSVGSFPDLGGVWNLGPLQLNNGQAETTSARAVRAKCRTPETCQVQIPVRVICTRISLR